MSRTISNLVADRPEEHSALYRHALDQLENLGAIATGAGDELSFGLVDKYIPGAKKLGEDNPWASNIGRVGSYAVPLPLPNKLRALIKAPGVIAKSVPAIERLLAKLAGGGLKKTVVRGAIQGVAAGEGQHIVRKAIGTADDTGTPTSTKDRLLAEGMMGGAGSLLGRLLTKIAPIVYNHPALINKYKLRESSKQAQKLMEEGTWGGLNGDLAKRSEELKSGIGRWSKKNEPKIRARDQADAANIGDWERKMGAEGAKNPPGVIDVSKIPEDKRALTGKRGKYNQQMRPEGELKNTNSAYDRLYNSLDPDQYGATSFDRVAGARKNMNERVSSLKSEMRAKAFGDPGLGDVSQNIDTALQGRKTLNDLYEKAIMMLGDPGDLKKFKGHVQKYRRGADLEENLLNYERKQHSQSTFFNPDLLRNAARMSIASAPIRTGVGVATHRIAPKIRDTVGGRAAELRYRKKGEPAPAEEEHHAQALESTADNADNGEDNQFLSLVANREKESDPTVPPVDDAARASGHFLGLKDLDLEVIRDPSNPVKLAAWNKLESRRAANRKPKAKEPDPIDGEEENPFLQHVLTR